MITHTLPTPRLMFVFMALLIFATTPSFAAEGKGANGPAVQFVKKLGDTALMSLTGKDVSRISREKRVREILQTYFDVPTIGKFALGTQWKEATEKQRAEYMRLFEDMVVQTYTTRFEDYSGQTLKVAGSNASGRDFLVQSQVIQKDGPPVNLEWRIRPRDGDLKVVDVVVEGISMSVTQRSDFSSVIQGAGGSIDALITSLRERKKAIAAKKE